MQSEYDASLKAVLDTIVDGVILIDNVGLINRYNPACEKIFGYTASEVRGKNINMLMPDRYRHHHDDYISNYRKTGQAQIIGIGREVSGQRKNGDIFPMYLSVGENRTQGQEGYVGIIRDLSEDVEKTENYNRLQQEYFHLSRVAAMNQLGTAIAHELNQPLAAIMNYLQAATTTLQAQESIDKEKFQQILSKSTEQVDRAAKTLSSLRRFIKSGEIQKEGFDLLKVVKTSVKITLLGFSKMNVSITYDFPNDLPEIFGSDVQIQQVLVNLLRNACEAMESSQEKTLILNAKLVGENIVQIGVVDTGEGLSSEKIDLLFNLFSSDKKDGLGVGLSISQSIVSGHGGKLWCEHNPREGSGFYFTLPVKG